MLKEWQIVTNMFETQQINFLIKTESILNVLKEVLNNPPGWIKVKMEIRG